MLQGGAGAGRFEAVSGKAFRALKLKKLVGQRQAISFIDYQNFNHLARQ
jgi:hypothetical protein